MVAAPAFLNIHQTPLGEHGENDRSRYAPFALRAGGRDSGRFGVLLRCRGS